MSSLGDVRVAPTKVTLHMVVRYVSPRHGAIPSSSRGCRQKNTLHVFRCACGEGYHESDMNAGFGGMVTPGDSPSRRTLLTGAMSLLPWTVDDANATESTITKGSVRVREAKMVARIMALRGSVPQVWMADFRTALEGYGIVSMSFKPTLKDIYKELETTTVDAVTLGDAWLDKAIQEGCIQPLEEPERYRYWKGLSPRWKRLVRRQGGSVYGIPYRWGCTVVVYRQDKLKARGRISDWDDLLMPALGRRIAFMDSPREIVGIALKTLGMSYNSSSLDMRRCGISEDDVIRRVAALVSQARVISNTDHIRAYSAGDVDVIVGSSDDLIPLAQKSSNSALIVPSSGTALWADVWCIPSHAAGGAQDGEPSPLLPAWFELCLQPVRANPSTGLQRGASPLLLPSIQSGKKSSCHPLRSPADGKERMDPRELPSIDVLEKSEFLESLDDATLSLYRKSLDISLRK